MLRADPWTSAALVAYHWRLVAKEVGRPWKLRWHPVCASTELLLSKWLKEKPFLGNQPRALLAARQNFGKGQRERPWESPNGGVWISAAFPWVDSKESSGLIGLTVALALIERLEKHGINACIKWPNDLLVGGRKIAGLLPGLVYRGSEVRLARIGLGLNVCNRVPSEGISLLELLRQGQCQPISWTVEVLLALERAMEWAGEADWVCVEAERRLWTREVPDPSTGELWAIKGLDLNGALRLKKGSISTTWTRWG